MPIRFRLVAVFPIETLMRSVIFSIIVFLSTFSTYAQTRMTDRGLEDLAGFVKTVKTEWKDLSTDSVQKTKGDIKFISQKTFSQAGQILEELYGDGAKIVYAIIDGS